jgi:transcriptional regulator with XRE-family HTH domain
MTQERLALLIGTTQDRVSRWESGACRPDLEHLADIVVQLQTRIRFELRGSSIVVEVAELGSPLVPIGDAPLPDK